MRVLIINSVCGYGSTGKICSDIAQQLIRQGHECTVAYGRDGNVPEHLSQHSCRIGTDFEVKLHGLKTRLLDAHGFGSTNATKRFVSWIKDYNPDVIHLHNLHGYYIDVEVLFNYLKTCGKKIIWTLHDCWAFTGHCAYFTAAKCEKWKDKCKDCPSEKEYPATCLLESAERNFERKKRAFTGVEKMRIVVPSDWLKRLVGESFLRDYPVTVIRNGIKKCRTECTACTAILNSGSHFLIGHQIQHLHSDKSSHSLSCGIDIVGGFHIVKTLVLCKL